MNYIEGTALIMATGSGAYNIDIHDTNQPTATSSTNIKTAAFTA